MTAFFVRAAVNVFKNICHFFLFPNEFYHAGSPISIGGAALVAECAGMIALAVLYPMKGRNVRTNRVCSHFNFSSDMAFFSDGKNDYFSLSLAPSRTRVYIPTDKEPKFAI